MLAAVIGYIDERRFELHQRIKVLIQRLYALAFQRGRISKRYERFFGLFDVIGNLHNDKMAVKIKPKEKPCDCSQGFF